MLNLKDQHILILGLGDSGLSMARWCDYCGAKVTVLDNRAAPPHLNRLQEVLPQVTFVHGEFESAHLQREPFKAVFKSPGLSPLQVQSLWQSAIQMGLVVGTELTLFAQALQDLQERASYQPQVLAITGTNGKTTVTSLTGLLLKRAGLRVEVAGNIGPAMLEQLLGYLNAGHLQDLRDDRVRQMPAPSFQVALDLSEEEVDSSQEAGVTSKAQSPEIEDEQAFQALASSEDSSWNDELQSDAINDQAAQEREDGLSMEMQPTYQLPQWVHDLPQAWVLELSSFQLDGVANFNPSMACVLNVSQDHLDWHGSLEHYLKAKSKVFGPETVRLINRDDEFVDEFRPEPLAMLKTASKGKSKRAVWVEFGLGMPTRVGDFGVEHAHGMSWLVQAQGSKDVPGKRSQAAKQATPEVEGLKRLMPLEALQIHGSHNASNALAALALASSTMAPVGPMLYALSQYKGEPHRVQSIGVHQGVEYFDDSKGTNVGATLAAVRGLGSERQLVLILGGQGKGQDFKPLLPALQRSARAVVLLGQDRELIAQSLKELTVPMHMVDSMPEAVTRCTQMAQSGDAVLLSPACASLDMFKNYAHRAEAFLHAFEQMRDVSSHAHASSNATLEEPR